MIAEDRNAQLSLEITNLKKNLDQTYKKRKSLLHPELMGISMLLDEKIVEYMKMKKYNRRENEELREMVFIDSEPAE